MVVLCAGICTKSGRALVARSFVEMTRVRVEGLLAAFPKLIGSNKQHTYVETEAVRYVYQPLENLYVLIVTNKASNILEDLETLHLIARIVPEYVRAPSEASVTDKKFELVAAIDEVLSLGYKEDVTLAKVRTYTEMESHEERIWELVQRNKEREAREAAKRRMIEMERERKEMKSMGGTGRRGISSQDTPRGMSSVGGGSGDFSTSTSIGGGSGVTTSTAGGGGGGGSGADVVTSAGGSGRSKQPRKKMTLGAKKKNAKNVDLMAQLRAEGSLPPASATATAAAGGSAATAAAATAASTAPVCLRIEESITVVADRDCSVENMEIKGFLHLLVNDPEAAAIVVQVEKEDEGYKFMTHPHIDKKKWNASAALTPKSKSRVFPTAQETSVVKWRRQTAEDEDLPLLINCWPDENEVSVEYELQDTSLVLKNVVVRIPIPAGVAPTIKEAAGSYNFTRDSVLEWQLPLIDETNPTGTLEFNGDGSDGDEYFPVAVAFECERSFCGFSVQSVVLATDGTPVEYDLQTVIGTASYEFNAA